MSLLSKKITIMFLNSMTIHVMIPHDITDYFEIRNILRNELIKFGYKPHLISLYKKPNEKNIWSAIQHTGKYDITHQIHFTIQIINRESYCDITHQIHFTHQILNSKDYCECDEDKYLELKKLKFDINCIVFYPITVNEKDKLNKYKNAFAQYCYN